jgi:ornithine--oxo-acid transaminase
VEAWDVCVRLNEKGLLCKPTHRHIIRLAPPLVITRPQLAEAMSIIREVFDVTALICYNICNNDRCPHRSFF